MIELIKAVSADNGNTAFCLLMLMAAFFVGTAHVIRSWRNSGHAPAEAVDPEALAAIEARIAELADGFHKLPTMTCRAGKLTDAEMDDNTQRTAASIKRTGISWEAFTKDEAGVPILEADRKRLLISSGGPGDAWKYWPLAGTPGDCALNGGLPILTLLRTANITIVVGAVTIWWHDVPLFTVDAVAWAVLSTVNGAAWFCGVDVRDALLNLPVRAPEPSTSSTDGTVTGPGEGA